MMQEAQRLKVCAYMLGVKSLEYACGTIITYGNDQYSAGSITLSLTF